MLLLAPPQNRKVFRHFVNEILIVYFRNDQELAYGIMLR